MEPSVGAGQPAGQHVSIADSLHLSAILKSECFIKLIMGSIVAPQNNTKQIISVRKQEMSELEYRKAFAGAGESRTAQHATI